MRKKILTKETALASVANFTHYVQLENVLRTTHFHYQKYVHEWQEVELETLLKK